MTLRYEVQLLCAVVRGIRHLILDTTVFPFHFPLNLSEHNAIDSSYLCQLQRSVREPLSI